MIRPEKEEPMEALLMPTSHWVTMEKLLNIRKIIRKLQRKLVIGPEKEEPMDISILFSSHRVPREKPLSIMRKI